jgi:hypothetical protein
MTTSVLDLRTALCLASATYCGWIWPGVEILQEDEVHGRLESVLASLHVAAPEVVGRWEILWGPPAIARPAPSSTT